VTFSIKKDLLLTLKNLLQTKKNIIVKVSNISLAAMEIQDPFHIIKFSSLSLADYTIWASQSAIPYHKVFSHWLGMEGYLQKPSLIG
jgi:hypothetical protein